MPQHSATDAAPEQAEAIGDAVGAHWRAANYLAAAQIYLQDNFLLERPLRPEDIKPRLLGHWGTCPGLNFIYAHLNRLILAQPDAEILLVTGPGHGAPAIFANLYLEGSLAEFYPEFTLDHDGLSRLIGRFSWPGGFPSHLFPGTPGVINEGGELGYALATAFGAAFDNPGLIVAAVIGDGEAETGPTATAWHSIKFLNPATDGAVLPVLHLNGYKIASATVYGAMTDEELTSLFRGHGYAVTIIQASDDHDTAHRAMSRALDNAYAAIRGATVLDRPRWPMLILRSPKGWTGIRELKGKPVEGSFRSHQVPAEDVRKDPQQLKALGDWLRSYKPDELFDRDGRPTPIVLRNCPRGQRRMGMNAHANGGRLRRELDLPDFRAYAVAIDRPGTTRQKDTAVLAQYLRDVIRRNEPAKNFRIVCPDEMTSNRLAAVFEATHRQFQPQVDPADDFMSTRGRVLEVLSEHTCQGWLQGYLLTGRHGLFPCYEAFAPIVDSMMNQYAKFLKMAAETPWREPVSSLNYLLSSEGWRQDHNGYSHQGPGFINHLLTKKARNVRIYLPPDANCLVCTIDHCLTSKDKINLVVASKQPMPQWLNMDQAIRHCVAGASVWEWASTDGGVNPHVVLACAGVYPTAEALAAASLLRRDLPGLHVRVVNVTDLLILEPDTFHPHGLTSDAFDELFTPDRPVIFNFHGYPSAVKQLLFERPNLRRFRINGYIEEGTTTTPFILLMLNNVDRYHVAIQAIRAAAPTAAEKLAVEYERQREEAKTYGERRGQDMEEIREWSWA